MESTRDSITRHLHTSSPHTLQSGGFDPVASPSWKSFIPLVRPHGSPLYHWPDLVEVPRTIGQTSWKSLVPLVGPHGSPSYHWSDLMEVSRTIGRTSWKSLVPLVRPRGSTSYHWPDIWGLCLLGCCSKTLEFATHYKKSVINSGPSKNY